MRYLLTAVLTLLAASPVMADEFVCTDELSKDGGGFMCGLVSPEGVDLGSGCFVFEESTDAAGLLSGELTIDKEGFPTLVSDWVCHCGTSLPEEKVMCEGHGFPPFEYRAQASGKITDGGDSLVMDSVGFEGVLGAGGTSTCVRDSACDR